jgi:uncharacterized membrane protein YbhN (UPF0104 family)
VKSSFWKTLLKYGIGLAILAWVVWNNWEPTPPRISTLLVSGGAVTPNFATPGLEEMLFHRQINILPLLGAMVLSALGLLITFLRWHLLVRAQGLEFSRFSAIRLGLVGYFFNTFLPGSVGGDLLKAIGIARDQSRRTVAVATVLIDRAVGLWGVLWMVSLVGGYFSITGNPILEENPHLQRIVRWASLIVLASVLVWVILSLLPERVGDAIARRLGSVPKLGHNLSEVWRAVWLYQKQRKAIIIALLLSVIGHTGWVLVFHCSTRVFDIPNSERTLGSLEEHFMISPVGNTAQALFPTPGGVGGGEAMFGWLYSKLDKPSVNGVLGCLAQRLVFIILGLIGYVIYLRMGASQSPIRDKDPTPEGVGSPREGPVLSSGDFNSPGCA